RTMPDASSDLFYGDPAIVRFDEDAADNNRLFLNEDGADGIVAADYTNVAILDFDQNSGFFYV
uniref:hypothetical protein n=1 Tax=Pseudoruegeria sp. HB172150 TaxID=2721164 RepID=UPI001555272C